MKISAREILDTLGTESEKKVQASVYLSEAVLEKFKKSCEPTPYSRVVEHLMELFIKSAEDERR